jgi:hypothetical protein
MTTRAILPGLSDRQVERLVELARPLEISKREVFLERLGFLLRGCRPDLSDARFELALQRAMLRLTQTKPAA